MAEPLVLLQVSYASLRSKGGFWEILRGGHENSTAKKFQVRIAGIVRDVHIHLLTDIKKAIAE